MKIINVKSVMFFAYFSIFSLFTYSMSSNNNGPRQSKNIQQAYIRNIAQKVKDKVSPVDEEAQRLLLKLRHIQKNLCSIKNKTDLEALLSEERLTTLLKEQGEGLTAYTDSDRKYILSIKSEIDARGHEEKADFNTTITCLSTRALKENTGREQLLYYLENIRPYAASGSLDNTSSSLQMDLKLLTQNEKFSALKDGPGNMIAEVVEVEKRLATIISNCLSLYHLETSTCSQKLLNELTQIKKSPTTTSDETLVRNAKIAMIMDWYSVLLGRPAAQIDFNFESRVNSILNPILNPTLSASPRIDSTLLTAPLTISLTKGSNLDGVLENIEKLIASIKITPPAVYHLNQKANSPTPRVSTVTFSGHSSSGSIQ